MAMQKRYLASFLFLALFFSLLTMPKSITERAPGQHGECHQSGMYISNDGWAYYSEMVYQYNKEISDRIDFIASRMARGLV